MDSPNYSVYLPNMNQRQRCLIVVGFIEIKHLFHFVVCTFLKHYDFEV